MLVSHLRVLIKSNLHRLSGSKLPVRCSPTSNMHLPMTLSYGSHTLTYFLFAFYSKKLTSAERNCDVSNWDLLAVEMVLEEMRHWLNKALHPGPDLDKN